MRFASIVAAALLAAAAFSAPAVQAQSGDGYDRRIIVINRSSLKIMKFYASNVGTNDWQEDVLGRYTIPAGGSQLFNIDDGTGYCQYDFKAVMENGVSVYRYDVNVCDADSWTITN